jgi:hypothetical protein
LRRYTGGCIIGFVSGRHSVRPTKCHASQGSACCKSVPQSGSRAHSARLTMRCSGRGPINCSARGRPVSRGRVNPFALLRVGAPPLNFELGVMSKRKRSPQEKKVLSYVKDRRNGIAKSRGIAHLAISKRKANANQAKRSATRGTLVRELRGAGDLENIDVHVAETGSSSWRKSPDMPLSTYLEGKIRSRPHRGLSSKAKPSPLLAVARRSSKAKAGR